MRARKIVPTLLIVAALAAGALAPAQADDLDEQQERIDDQISDARHDLEAASKELQQAAADLERSRSQMPAARAALESTMGKLGTARDRLDLIRQRLRQLQAEQEKVLLEIEMAQKRIDASEILIARIVRYQYQTGGYGELQVVLDAESPSDFMQRLAATQSVTDSQTAVIGQLNADKAILAAREQQMAVTEEAIESAEGEAEAEVTKLNELASEAREAKAKIRELIAVREGALATAERLETEERERLQDLKSAQEALNAQIAAQTSSGGGLPNGELESPIPGASYNGGVGWRVHPVYGYRSCHTGIDISASSGTQIHAARGGVVVWTKSDLSGPYGNNTLVDHGDGLSTFYAHQSSFAVSPGDRVKTGEVIGYVGSTGYSSGPHLHFEVHINGVPHDPMGWFGGSKRSVSEFCPGYQY